MDPVGTRRKTLGILAGGAVALSVGALSVLRRTQSDVFQNGQLLGTIPFLGETNVQFDEPIGEELDGRQYLDLAHFHPSSVITPTDLFYLRTRVSHVFPGMDHWMIRLTGWTGASSISIKDLAALSRPQGVHLLECAGNTRSVRFGMLSVASWDGVPIGEILDRLQIGPNKRVLVSGFDTYAQPPKSPSVPGASWVFSRGDLENAHAFLGLSMNGQPLTLDHGAPVRLVVPGWYGCVAIKWINEITSVPDSVEATSQMKEYAARTHQDGAPSLARDYRPATIDTAALPVRIERWLVGGRIQYKVKGIVWGGAAPVRDLMIRFRPDQPYRRIPAAQWAGGGSMGFWECAWRPKDIGIYRIRLKLADGSIPARRLDEGLYVRGVQINQV